MGADVRKQYMLLAGKPIVCQTVAVFDACACIDEIILVVPADDLEICFEKWITGMSVQKSIRLVAGGAERQDSVYQGIQSVSGGCDIVVIHDAVRPFVTHLMIESCVAEARVSGACIIGMPMMETAKRVISGDIGATLDRSTIWMAQTPQAFAADLIRTAHEKARRDRFVGTDDALLVERLKRTVRILPGSRLNIKITTPEDVVLAEGIIHLMPSGFR